MRFINKFFLTLLCVIAFTTASAQEVISLRINELFINNTDNYVDGYGRHVPWVEIFNTSYNSVNIADCYITNDTTGLAAGKINPNWYKIPKGDPRTIIPQRGYVVFYLDNTPTYGTMHTNFDPREDKSSNYVALINSNGKALIHIFTYPESLRTNDAHSYGYRVDFRDEAMVESGEKMIQNLDFLDYFTPGSTNDHEVKATKSEFIQEKDPYGIGLAIISMSVVFSTLFLLFLIIKGFNLFNKRFPPKAGGHGHGHGAPAPAPKEEKPKNTAVAGDLSEETLAAIAMAIHCHFGGQHDMESGVLTFNDGNSPWAHKHLPIKKIQRK